MIKRSLSFKQSSSLDYDIISLKLIILFDFKKKRGLLMSANSSNSKHLYFSNDCNFPKEYEWYIALGSILSAYNGDYVNDLKTFYHIKWIENGLSKMWDIKDNKTFKDTANWLIEEGHRTKYLPRLDLLKRYRFEIENANIFFRILFKILPDSAISYYQKKNKNHIRDIKNSDNLNYKYFGKLLQIAVEYLDLYQKNIGDYIQVDSLLAWDAVRLINISRWALNCNYINEEEFYYYISQIKEPIQNTYDNWQQIALAYATAAIIWHPVKRRAKSFPIALGELLNDERSLLVTCPFK